MSRIGSLKSAALVGLWSLTATFGNAASAAPTSDDLQPPCYTDNQAHVAIDAHSGVKLLGESEDMAIQPASMAKMMSLLIMHEAMQEGLINPRATLIVSDRSREAGDLDGGIIARDLEVFKKDIKHIRNDHALYLIAMRSLNDLTIGLAKDVAVAHGSEKPNEEQEEDFVVLMNARATSLNMNDTYFVNSTGLPDAESRTTASDMARLMKYIHDEQPGLFKIMGRNAGQFANEWVEHTNTLEFEKPFSGKNYNVVGKTGFVNDICRAWALAVEDKARGVDVVYVSVGHRGTWPRHHESIPRINKAMDAAEAVTDIEHAEIIDWRIPEPSPPKSIEISSFISAWPYGFTLEETF